jgi:peroxiredoxin
LQKLYDEFKDKGLEIIAINSTDSKETILKFIEQGKFSFSIGMDQLGQKDYGVTA